MALEARDDKGLSIYWDYESARLNIKAVTGYDVVRKICSAVHTLGPVQSFKAYHDPSNRPLSNLRSELGSSGVTLIDCPGNRRKEVATKMMIVDIIAHAWDHPAPRTIVVITGDRDLAYLIATLRMRRYEVVLISPSGTHYSLTNQASVNLDWTGIANVDGRRTDMDDSCGGQPSPHPPPSPHLLPSPSFPPPPLPASNGLFPHFPKGDFSPKAQEEINPPMVELRGMPTTRGRQISLFPHPCGPDRFNIFGDLGDSFVSSRTSNGIFGLGDGPLFSRSQPRVPACQVRSDSAPPDIIYSTHSPSRPCSSPESNGFGRIASSMKGKQRDFPITEPEDIAPQSPLCAKMPEVSQSASVIGMAEGFLKNMHPSKVNAPLTSGTSTHSSVTSRDSAFSVIQFPPSSAPPASADPVYINDDMMEGGKNPATIVVIAPQEPTSAQPKSPGVRDTEKISDPHPLPGKEGMGKAISIKGSPQVDLPIQPQVPNPFRPSPTPPSSSKKAPSSKETNINAQAGPSSNLTPSSMYVPPQFRVLVETLRQHKGPYIRGSLSTLLLARDPDVYNKAQVSKYKRYIAAAVKAGLVREVTTTKGPCISLTAEYA